MHNNKYIPSNDIAILIVYKIIKKNTLESNFSNNYLIKRLFAKLKDLKKKSGILRNLLLFIDSFGSLVWGFFCFIQTNYF